MSYRCTKGDCGWVDASAHFERFDGDPCPRCGSPIATIPHTWKLVIIESPYGRNIDGSVATPAEIERNTRYLRACMKDCLDRHEAPYASHALYTQPGVLDDGKPEERKKGMEAGWAWQAKGELVVIYTDLGITTGMREGIHRAHARGQSSVERQLGGEWKDAYDRWMREHPVILGE